MLSEKYFSSLDKAVGSLRGLSCVGFVLVWLLRLISLLGFDLDKSCPVLEMFILILDA